MKQQPERWRVRVRRARVAVGCGTFAIGWLVASPAASIVIDVSDINVSDGLVYEKLVSVPVGATVTIGVRISNPALTTWYGIGLSYYGYDPALLDFVSGDAAATILATCIPPSICFGGGTNLVGGPLVETNVFPTVPLAGEPRVRSVLFMSDYNPISGSGLLDPGFDGVVGGSDAQIRVTFEGLAEGVTEVEIGTGDDRGGILLEATGISSQATNARVRIVVPEPGMGWALLGAAALGFGRRRDLARLR